MRRNNCKHIKVLDRGIGNQQTVIRKVYLSSVFLLINTFAIGLDKDTVAVALAATVDHSVTSEKDSSENGMPGFTPQSSVSSTVFNDINGNGIQDPGEMGVAGINVKLFEGEGISEINVGPDGTLGTLDDSPGGMITDASGGYHFDNLTPNTYRVIVTTQ